MFSLSLLGSYGVPIDEKKGETKLKKNCEGRERKQVKRRMQNQAERKDRGEV